MEFYWFISFLGPYPYPQFPHPLYYWRQNQFPLKSICSSGYVNDNLSIITERKELNTRQPKQSYYCLMACHLRDSGRNYRTLSCMPHAEYHIALNSSQWDRCKAIIRSLRTSWFIILKGMVCETLFAKDRKKHLELWQLILGFSIERVGSSKKKKYSGFNVFFIREHHGCAHFKFSIQTLALVRKSSRGHLHSSKDIICLRWQ